MIGRPISRQIRMINGLMLVILFTFLFKKIVPKKTSTYLIPDRQNKYLGTVLLRVK